MTRTNTPTVDEYWEALAKHLPTFSPEDQHVAVTLYRELAKGQPVDAAQLSRALGVPQPGLDQGVRLSGRRGTRARFWRSGGGTDAPSLGGGRPYLVDLVRVGQPLHSGDLGEAGARRVARPGYRRARPTRPDARRDRVCRSAERRRLVPVAGRARLRHVRR